MTEHACKTVQTEGFAKPGDNVVVQEFPSAGRERLISYASLQFKEHASDDRRVAVRA